MCNTVIIYSLASVLESAASSVVSSLECRQKQDRSLITDQVQPVGCNMTDSPDFIGHQIDFISESGKFGLHLPVRSQIGLDELQDQRG